MGVFESILLAVSLCADCFAVSLCSSVSISKIKWGQVLCIASCFAVIQAGLLFAGWAFGNLFVGFIEKFSHWIGFLLLLYVGGEMFIGGLKNELECRNLCGIRNVIIGGIATSIDALAVGVAQSMAGQTWTGFWVLLLSVFVVTALSVIAGMWGGKILGDKFGRWAEIVGGLVLIAIGVNILI